MNESTNKRTVELFKQLRQEMKLEYSRHVSYGDLIADRWETAEFLGFGEGTSCYNNVLVLGDVKVGKNCWIGPNCILDGSGGGLTIGNYCSISAGVQIYTHNTVDWATSMGQAEVSQASVDIGSGVYIGPQSIIEMGIKIGNKAIIGAMSLVRQDVPEGRKAFGCPAKIR